MTIPGSKSAERAWLVWARRKKRPIPGAPPPSDLLGELKSLVEAAGGIVAGVHSQALSSEHPATLIGSGTVEHLKEAVREKGVDLVVFQNLLRPNQQANLERELGVKVLDRREVILDIFARRARSREGKLQIELAQLSFRLARLIGGRRDLSRLGGGIGTRGPGEKKLEEDRRRIRTHIRQIERELSTVRRTRTLHYRRRREVGFPVVALVGYTNAGKSTLFNRITGADVFVAEQLFATLDPTARRFSLPGGGAAILVDTVGFIHDLPDEIREAFLATLEGIGEADLLIHVADGISEMMEENISSVEGILSELGFSGKPCILAINKSDLTGEAGHCPPGAIRISAATGSGIPGLLKQVEGGLWLHRSAGNGSTRRG